MRGARLSGLVLGCSAVLLVGCSSPPSTLSPADNIAVDCTAAAQAIADYSAALSDLLIALEASNGPAANTSAAKFGLGARAIVDELPGLPQEAQGFVATSQRFAERVRDVIGGNGDLPPLATEAETQFSETSFMESVDVVESFFSANCPTTIIPTPSPRPS
jgi:hypothetical protein